MGKFTDLTGMKFNHWVVLRRDEDRFQRDGRVFRWLCRCDCGTERMVSGRILTAGKSRSCGHDRRTTFIDLTGMKFNRLTVLERAEDRITRSGKRISRWMVRCDCGQEKIVDSAPIRYGTTKSCGCLHRERLHRFNNTRTVTYTDLTGQRFGRLTVLGRTDDYITPSTRKGAARWLTRCDCGQENSVVGGQLKGGKTRSCGCIRKETVRKTKRPTGTDHYNWSESPSYFAIHRRLIKFRGRASSQSCINCGKLAHHWSCNWSRPLVFNELGWYYSVNLADYDPRCGKCHSAYDSMRPVEIEEGIA